MKVRFPLILSIMFSLQVFAAEYNSEATSIALNAKFDPNKYTVCSITINSDNEKKLFSRFIKDQNSKLSKLPESKKKDLTSYNEEILELTSPELIGDSKKIGLIELARLCLKPSLVAIN